MKGRRVLFIAITVCLSSSSWGIDTCGPDGVSITTPNGDIRGECKTVVVSENVRADLKVFLGVPYAEPPVGGLRFRTTQAVKAWGGTLNATGYKRNCLRFKDDLFEPMAAMSPTGGSHVGHNTNTGHETPMTDNGSEDCLYLNVFIPATNTTSPLGVLIWFPGHDRVFDASALAAVEDVIVVTVSFRTGLFGFLSVGKPGFSGNYGLHDQKMAMKWVQENIQLFGGDPGKVTIAGQGISGAMVGLHILHNVTQTLFTRAMSLSGFILDPYIVRDIHVMEHLVYDHLKCNDDSVPNVLVCLQGKSIEELTMHLSHLRQRRPFTVLFGPTIDGDFLKDDPKVLLEAGKFTQVEYLLGGNRDDGSVLFNNIPVEAIKHLNQTTFISYIRAIASATFTDPDTVAAAILGRYLMLGELTYGEKLLRAGSDFIQGNSLMSAEKMSENSNVFYFQFNHIPENSNVSVVGYGQLIPFVLGNLFPVTDYRNMEMNHTDDMNHTRTMNQKHSMNMSMMWTNEERNLSLAMMRAWAGFVKNGMPNMETGLDWERFNSSKPRFLEWGTDMIPGNIMHAPNVEVTEFWWRTIPIIDKPVETVPTTATSAPEHGHGDHTTPGHEHDDHAGTPVIDMDLNTAAEAVLALTIVVCFLFVVVVALLFVNFKYGPKYARKENYNLKNNASVDPPDIATKM